MHADLCSECCKDDQREHGQEVRVVVARHRRRRLRLRDHPRNEEYIVYVFWRRHRDHDLEVFLIREIPVDFICKKNVYFLLRNLKDVKPASSGGN